MQWIRVLRMHESADVAGRIFASFFYAVLPRLLSNNKYILTTLLSSAFMCLIFLYADKDCLAIQPATRKKFV